MVRLSTMWLIYAMALIARDLTSTAPIDYRSGLLFAALASALVVGFATAAGTGSRWWPAPLSHDSVRLAVAVGGATVLIAAMSYGWPAGGDRPMPLGVIVAGGFFGLLAMIPLHDYARSFALLRRALHATFGPPTALLASWASDLPAASGRTRPRISIVLPTFNGEHGLESTVLAAVEGVKQLDTDPEVIVVHDGSEDGTGLPVAALARADSAIRCVSHPAMRGYGVAAATGFAAATGDLVFLTAGDGRYDARQAAEFLPLMRDADLVTGYRAPYRDSRLARIFSDGWNLLVNLLFGYVAGDSACAFMVFRRSILERIPLSATGIAFNAELLIEARALGFRILERPVRHCPKPAGRARGTRPAVVGRALLELLRLRLHLAARLPPASLPFRSVTEPESPRARAACYVLLAFGLAAMLAYCAALGVTYYGKVEPFFDSAAYQSAYFGIIDSYREQGYVPTMHRIRAPATTFAYTLAGVLFAPFLPRSVLGLYAIMYGLALYALLVTVYAAEKLAASWLRALSFVLFVLSAAIFSHLWGGILDQRLDLLAGLLFLASVACCWLLFRAPTTFRHWALLLVTTTLAIVHRPTLASQIAPVFLVVAGFHGREIGTLVRQVRVHHVVAVLLAGGFIAWLILPSLSYLEYYYLEWNVDVGRSASVMDVLREAMGTLGWALGAYAAVLLALLLLYAVRSRRYADAAFSVALLVASLGPFVITRSNGNPLVFLPSAMVATLGYLALIRRIRVDLVVVLLLVSSGAVALGNVGALHRQVKAVAPEQRAILDRVTDRLSRSAQPAYVSGTVPIAGSIVALDTLYGSRTLVAGEILSHSTDYGLGKTYDIDDPETSSRVQEALQAICRLHGYAVFMIPTRPDDQAGYLFSSRHTAMIWELKSQLPCLGEQLDTFHLEDADFAVYPVLDGARPVPSR
jgi:cellulose synthase/poly-beta-1,6-N-acetylglucosamine synthase-like glycosyltransferase